MAFSDLFSGAKDMLDKAKHLVEETTGIDVDNAIAHPEDLMNKAKDAFAHPETLIEQAKAKGSALFSQLTGSAEEAAPEVAAKTATQVGDAAETETEEEDDDSDETPAATNATAKVADADDEDAETEEDDAEDAKEAVKAPAK